MAPRSEGSPANDHPVDDEQVLAVAACETRPGKYVFIERGNCDGWIASDEIVEIDP